MKVVEIAHFEDAVVLHFETDGYRINAYTLASILVSIADAAKAANSQLNPGYEVEIVVETIGPGSFRAKIKALYKKNRSLFANVVAVPLVVGLVTNYIYEKFLSSNPSVKVQINSDEVIIQSGSEKIVVPRKVYDATREAEKNPQFRDAVSKTFVAINNDPKIQGFGFVAKMNDAKPEIIASRETVAKLAVLTVSDDENDSRVVTEHVDLQIVKAILERGSRKWEFVWRGVRITAPIIDQAFYDEFIAHKITIAPGDVLSVRLAMNQKRDSRTGIFANDSYIVIEVIEHKPQPRQEEFLKSGAKGKRRKK
jgi:hypothetical protein